MGHLTSDKEKLAILKICTLFMKVDGACDEAEKALLNKVYQEMNVTESMKEEVLYDCASISVERGDNSTRIISVIDEILDDLGSYSSLRRASTEHAFPAFPGLTTISGAKKGPTVQANLLWTLINLGYADKTYTSAERKVVRHLAKIWNINKDLVTEFEDTADTILLLTNQQTWLKNESGWGYDQINERLKEIDKQIELMSKNLQTSISEIDVMGGK